MSSHDDECGLKSIHHDASTKITIQPSKICASAHKQFAKIGLYPILTEGSNDIYQKYAIQLL